jgi:metal transporter CNNM
MGLDTTGLEIVMSGDDPRLSRAATKIYPMRKDGNLLLCTLLLGNVAVNTLLGILMADITSGTVGFITSTAMIVIFGEIIPQATFSRYALQVGEKVIPVMKVIIVFFYVLAKPLAFCLDKLLGHELGTVYSKAEMLKLLEIHVVAGQLNKDEGQAMKGALKYQDMTVQQVYTPLDKTFMINVDDRLNFETMATIFKTGYSRIPVYENKVSNVVGLLFVKDLIFVNPVDETPVRSFVEIFGRGAHVVWADDKLGDVLTFLKKGHCHMAIVRDINKGDGTGDPLYEVKGIITLEDIIEVILGDQIVDETDAWVDVHHTTKVSRDADFDWAKLRLLDAKIVDQTLSEDEVRAVTAHLSSNFDTIFGRVSKKQLSRMVAATPVKELDVSAKEIYEFLPSKLLYEKDMPTEKCTLILGGKVTVIAGKDNFRSDLSSWSLLAPRALTDDLYTPDFSAYVSSGPCRCLQFTRDIFCAAIAATDLEASPQESSTGSDLVNSEDTGLTSFSKPSNLIDGHNDAPSSSATGEIGNGPPVIVEHRGKLLEKLLKEQSSHGHLGLNSGHGIEDTLGETNDDNKTIE